MKRIFLLAFSLVVLPLLTFAQAAVPATGGNGLQNFFKNLLAFISDKLIPFLIAAAFLLFVINAVRYFVIQSAEEEGRENAKNLALYSVLAFVFLILFWGMVNLLTSSIGLQGKSAPTPDYMELNGVSGGSEANGTNDSATTQVTCILPPDGHSERTSISACQNRGGTPY